MTALHNDMRTVIMKEHKGWTGIPYESNFDSIWGLLTKDQILDCRGCWNNKHARDTAVKQGYKYFIVPAPSKYNNQLYKDRGTGRCVYAEMFYNNEHAKTSKQNYQGSITHHVHMLLRAIKHRAKKKGISYSLNESNILHRFQKGICEKTGLPFVFRNSCQRSAFSPSVDRIDPSKGYIENNIQIVCLMYNLMKCNFSEDDVETLIKSLKLNG